MSDLIFLTRQRANGLTGNGLNQYDPGTLNRFAAQLLGVRCIFEIATRKNRTGDLC